MSITAGSKHETRARATRWRMPPDSSFGIGVPEGSQPDEGEEPIHGRLALGARASLHLQRPAHVTRHRAPGEEGEVLEHHAAVGTGTVHLAAVEAHRPAIARHEAAQDVEEGALAAAARADDGDELAVPDAQTEIVDRLDAVVPADEQLA